MTETKFRKCFKLVEHECDMADLKKGDIFRLEATSGEDPHINPNEYFFAVDGSKPHPPVEGNTCVDSKRVFLMFGDVGLMVRRENG